MDPADRFQRLFRIGVAVAAALLIAAITLLLLRSGQYDQLQSEYVATSEAALLLEQYVQTGVVVQLPPGVHGFGIYDADGQAVVTAGEAPAVVRPPREGEEITRFDGMLRLLRPVGGRGGGPFSPPAETAPEGHVAPGPTVPGATAPSGRGFRRMPSLSNQYLLLDYDISDATSRQRLERGALIGSAILTGIVLALIGLLYRKLQVAIAEREHERRLAQLGEAARTLAHEIKNPLTAAQMQSALLKRAVDQTQQERLRILDEELGRIRLLTDQVREFLRHGDGRPEPVPVAEVISEIGERQQIPIDLTADSGLRATMDPDRFRSTLSNVIQNAYEAMDQEGTVEVGVTTSRRDLVEVTVADRGIGIPPEERERIFDPFYTTKTRGSGVGLAVSRRFIEEAGGSIQIKDRPGGGTIVVIRLKGSRT